MNIEVTNCKDCPFSYNSGWVDEEYSCRADSKGRPVYLKDMDDMEGSFPILVEFEDNKDWCPLNNEVITVLKTGSDDDNT